jgi:hypothetical protein
VPDDTTSTKCLFVRLRIGNKEIGDISLEYVYKRINALKARVNLVLGDWQCQYL